MDRLRVLLADPSLFTAPYDAALSAGLRANGVVPRWAVRGLRPGEAADLDPAETLPFFYPLSDGPRRRAGGRGRLLKGLEHWLGMARLTRLAATQPFDLVHLQWSVLPFIDIKAIAQLRRTMPVILTVHDTTPFNGKSVSRLQRNGFDRLLASVDWLVVHTLGGGELLQRQGIPESRIAVIPHGPLALKPTPAPPPPVPRQRWRIVMFGRLQSYKGVDTLIEALGQLDPAARSQIELIVAGEPMMAMEPVQARAAALGLSETVEFRLWRHDDQEMAALLHQADCFVFPYRAIEASGVLFLVADLGKWIVASDLGAFRETIGQSPGAGALVPPDDPAQLAAALTASIGQSPTAPAAATRIGWDEIGAMTRRVYEAALRERLPKEAAA